MRRLAGRMAAALALLAAAACSSGQDPGVEPQVPSGDRGSTTTPQLLQPCPPGGPDGTTPAAGCVDDDGNVRR
jgi:hypothetical protein